MHLHQEDYIKQIVIKANVERHCEQPIPLRSDFLISSEDSPKTKKEIDEMKDKQKKYMEIVGCLLWCSRWTRPYIALAVSILSRYTHNPSNRHYQALLGVVCYLKGNPRLGLKYTRSNLDKKLTAYIDSDWAGDRDTRHSTSGM